MSGIENASSASEISFSEEQAMLLDMSVRFARESSDFEAVRKRMAEIGKTDKALWQEFVEMGWTGLLVPEAHGGSELGLDALTPIAESLGRYLLASPLISTSLATQLILDAGDESQHSTWLPKLATGTIVTPALFDAGGSWSLISPDTVANIEGDTVTLSGTKVQVSDAADADAFIVSAKSNQDTVLILVEKELLGSDAIVQQKVYDETRNAFKIIFDGVQVPTTQLLSGGDLKEALHKAERTGELLYSAEMAGGIAGTLELVLDYIKTRKAFGRPIGQFQSLKHPTAEILLSLEAARTLVYHAATMVASDPLSEKAEIATRMAKAHTSAAFIHAGDRAIQFHGGIGFTYECNAQLFLRRAMWSQAMFGDARFQRRRLAELLLDEN